MVVLKQHHVALAGQRQNFLAPRQRHGDRGGALVAGRHIGIGALSQRPGRQQPIGVDGQGPYPVAAELKVVAGIRVARVFDADNRLAVQQHVGQQITGHLGAGGDQNFIAPGHDAARRQQAVLYLLHQHIGVAVQMVLRPFFHRWQKQGLVGARAPVFQGHQAGVKLAVHKRVFEVLPVGRFTDVALLRHAADQAVLPLQINRLGQQKVGVAGLPHQNVGIHHQAAARARDQKALVHQHLLGQRDGIARHPQGLGQRAAGGHLGAWRHQPHQNAVDHHLLDAALQGAAAAGKLRKQFDPDAGDFLFVSHGGPFCVAGGECRQTQRGWASSLRSWPLASRFYFGTKLN